MHQSFGDTMVNKDNKLVQLVIKETLQLKLANVQPKVLNVVSSI